MLKYIKSLLIIMLLLFAIPMNVFADNETIQETETETTTEDEEEVVEEEEAQVLSTSLGAEIRLLQLQSRIEFQVESGNTIIERMQENNYSTTELEEIITNFENLIVEIEAIDVETQTSEELAEVYVSIKAQAIELSKNFKDTIKDTLSDEDKAKLKAKIKEKREAHENRKDERKEKLVELKAKYNANKAKSIMESLDVENPEELIEKIQSGELTAEDIRVSITAKFEAKPKEEREENLNRFKEEKQKIKIESKERVEELRIKAKESREQFNERFDDIKERLHELREENKKLKVQVKKNVEANNRPTGINIDERIESRIKLGDNRFESKEDGRVELRIKDFNEAKLRISHLIEVREDEISKLNERSEESTDEDEISKNNDRIKILKNQIENLNLALDKLEEISENAKEIKLKVDSNGEIELEIETEEEEE